MAWLGTWAKRVKLTVDNTDIDANLTDFPFLVYLSTSSGRNSEDLSFVFDELTADANRKKIAFTKSDGTTQLYAEIEKWDDVNEKAWIWVKAGGADAISSSADTDFYLYYDSAQDDNDTYIGDTNDEVAENVWDSSFKFVWHGRDGVDNQHIYDSTSNDIDGTKGGAGVPAVTTSAMVGEAQNFANNTDIISMGDVTVFDGATSLTMECLINFSTISDDARIIHKWGNYGSKQSFVLTMYDTNELRVGLQNSGLLIKNTTNANLETSTWYYIVVVWETPQSIAIYVNNEAKDLSISISENIASIYNSTTIFGIGYEADESKNSVLGIYDEIRISTSSRSAEWCKASYESLIDDLLDWGSEEESSGGGTEYEVDAAAGMNSSCGGGSLAELVAAATAAINVTAAIGANADLIGGALVNITMSGSDMALAEMIANSSVNINISVAALIAGYDYEVTVPAGMNMAAEAQAVRDLPVTATGAMNVSVTVSDLIDAVADAIAAMNIEAISANTADINATATAAIRTAIAISAAADLPVSVTVTMTTSASSAEIGAITPVISFKLKARREFKTGERNTDFNLSRRNGNFNIEN